MAKFKITFETDNAAFADNPAAEIAEILHTIARRVEIHLAPGGYFSKPVLDSNGNTVGKYMYTR